MYNTKKYTSRILKFQKVKTMLVYIVKRHTGYEVAVLGDFCTEYEIVTAGSEVMWLR